LGDSAQVFLSARGADLVATVTMSTFEHIFVATDFGESAMRALEVAINLAHEFESKLTLLHAYASPTSGYDYATGVLWPVDELSRTAKVELDKVLQKAKEQYSNIDVLLVCGEPWSKILETAERCGATLIVMGTHGRRGLSRVLLGSVAEKVVRLSPVPVLTVPDKKR
jgi:nucleotide-binding universal stress UspA family protein